MIEIVVETLFVLPSAALFPDDTQKPNSVVFIKLRNLLSPKGYTNKFVSMQCMSLMEMIVMSVCSLHIAFIIPDIHFSFVDDHWLCEKDLIWLDQRIMSKCPAVLLHSRIFLVHQRESLRT